MTRYDPYRTPNIFERLLGWVMLALVAAAVFAGVVGGAKWLWQHFTS